MADETITKRRVTMTNVAPIPGAKPDKDGRVASMASVYTDYVRPDFLDAYVEVARKKFQTVEVSEEPDAGPGGYHGATHVPESYRLRNPDGSISEDIPFPHPLAGRTFPATKKG